MDNIRSATGQVKLYECFYIGQARYYVEMSSQRDDSTFLARENDADGGQEYQQNGMVV